MRNSKRILSLVLSICLIATLFVSVGTVSAAGSKMLRMNGKAWQWVYQEVAANKFEAGSQYRFSIDYIPRSVGNDNGRRIGIYTLQSANTNYDSAIVPARVSGTTTYTATYTHVNSTTSGNGFKIELFTRTDSDDLYFGNPSLYKLDEDGDITGDNLIGDPDFATELSSDTWSSGAYPWYSNGSATKVSFLVQKAGYFDYDPEKNEMMIMHDKAWIYMETTVAANKFEYQANYRFEMEIIVVRQGSTGGDRFRAKPVNSGGDWINSVPTRVAGTNTYRLDFTHQYNSTSGNAFNVWLITRDTDDYIIYGNPRLYKMENGSPVGDNLIGDPGFHTGISNDTWASGPYPWYSNGSANTNCVNFVQQPENYFNQATAANPTPTGTAPTKHMVRAVNKSWGSLAYDTPYLVRNKTYRLTYNRKFIEHTNRTGTCAIQYRNSSGTTVGLPAGKRVDEYDAATCTQTVYITIPADAYQDGSNLKLLLYFGEDAGNVVYVGNFELYEIDGGTQQPVGSNLFVNGDFTGRSGKYYKSGSNGYDSALWNWEIAGSFANSETFEVCEIPANFFTSAGPDKKVLKVSGGDWSSIRKDALLEANTQYQLSFYYKYDSSAPTVGLRYIDTSNNFKNLQFTEQQEPANEYKKTYTFTMPGDVNTTRPENFVLYFYIRSNAHDTVAYWYDVQLYKLSGGTPDGQNLIDNGEFALNGTGEVTSLVGYDIESAPDRMDIINLPADDFFTYYSRITRMSYLINALLDRSQDAKSITTDVNDDGTVNVIDLVILKKEAISEDNEGGADQQAEAKKTAILNTANTETLYSSKITGTVYRISKSQTLANVPSLSTLRAGDAVLFERGGTYRLQTGSTSGFQTKAGVVYGSYGTGAKPIILGSPYDYHSRTWTNYSGNIWRTDIRTSGSSKTKNSDVVGNIYFNNGASYGTRKESTGELTQLGDYYSCDGDHYDGSDGYLYLYCTSNPATYYSNIEISNFKVIMDLADGVTIDNLDLRYGGSHAIAGKANNVTITNCSIGWIGGSFISDGRFGNGIQISQAGEHITIDNNYVYQVFDAGITFQSYSEGTNGDFKDIHITNNLIEYCVYSVEFFTLCDENGDGTDEVDNIYINNNIMRLAGYGWQLTEKPEELKFETSHIRVGQKRYWSQATNIQIRNNVFDCSTGCLIFWRQGDTVAQPGLSIYGNTFFQKLNADSRAMDFGLNINPVTGGSGNVIYATSQGGLVEAVASFDSNPARVKWLAFLR